MRVRAVIASAVGVAAALVGCGANDSGPVSLSPAVPQPAIVVSGDPAAISGAADSNADAASTIDSVVMIGDSITKGSMAYLDERFGLLGLDHTIEAENGKRMAVSSPSNPSGASVAAFLAENGDGDHSDEVWVVALGTNDVNQYASPDEIAAAVNEVLNEVPDDAAVVWVDTYVSELAEATDAINSIIRERVERRGDSVVAPWTAFVEGDGVLTRDGVHPTSGGADVFAFVVTDTVRAFLDR
ncbi:MAG TPA: SGNH/GDSL hydrolase family protein [Ilumatobacteraceae bacterium]|nr:SGNH/GDSL hydrolase family protein [Ilumatobacteraceae bacterium]